MDFKEIKKLVELVEEAQISHLGLEEDGVKIEIKKEVVSQTTSVMMPASTPPVAQMAAVAATQSSGNGSHPQEEVVPTSNLIEVKSQMVGTFYDSPNPDSPPFVKEGDTIKSGQILCIIEAMKLFNEIESEVSGTIEKVCTKVGDSVEFGQVLFLVNPA